MFIPQSQDLYLIGNGFDLYLGLKTSYKDFFKKNLLNEERKEIKKFIKELTENYEENSYKELEDKILEKIDKIKNYNLFLLYLLFEENNEIEQWNDVEKKIFPSVIKLYKLKNEIIEDILYLNSEKDKFDKIEITKKNLLEANQKLKNQKSKNISQTRKEFDDFFTSNLKIKKNSLLFDINNLRNSLKLGRKNIELKKNVDLKNIEILNLEKFMLLHPENKEIIEKYFFVKLFIEKYKEQKLNFDFLEELNKFEHIFGKYIEELNEIPLKSLDNISYDENIIKKIEKIFGEIDNKRERYIINFNYTNYLDKILMYHKMTNVHGTFENPIFGIDNTEIGNDREFYYLTKTSRVLFNNTIKEEFKLPNKIEISKICFFGHSLARADYSYFQSIFDYYDIYNSEVKLEFKYYNYIKDKKELTDEQKEERKDEVKSNMHKSVIELMNDYGNTASNKSRGQNLLHKLILENRIKIVEVE